MTFCISKKCQIPVGYPPSRCRVLCSKRARRGVNVVLNNLFLFSSTKNWGERNRQPPTSTLKNYTGWLKRLSDHLTNNHLVKVGFHENLVMRKKKNMTLPPKIGRVWQSSVVGRMCLCFSHIWTMGRVVGVNVHWPPRVVPKPWLFLTFPNY